MPGLPESRLAAQGVTAPLGSPASVVRRLLAVQGQDYPGTLWAVGLRCGADRASVEASFARREIVRTWPMRGTLHFLAAEDARWMLSLLAQRVSRQRARLREVLGLDDATMARARADVERRLAGRTMTRREILAFLREDGVVVDPRAGYHVLAHLAHEQCIVQAGHDVFALLEEWLPPADPVPRDEALARLALRYFTGHGPATEPDLAAWSGLPLRDVRAGIASVRADLERRDVHGAVHWSRPRSDAPPAGVHLLPGFDEMLLGYRDRSAVLDPANAGRVCPGGNGVFRATILADGRVTGTWRARAASRTVAVVLEPFDAPVDVDAVRPSAQRYATFLGKELSSVTVVG